MKSGKQKYVEIKAKRKHKVAKIQLRNNQQERQLRPVFGPAVNEALLAPNNSYGAPDYVYRGYYVNRPFRCVECGKEEVWTGTQQKWWYEVVKGLSIPRRCAAGSVGAKSANRVMNHGAFMWRVSNEKRGAFGKDQNNGSCIDAVMVRR